MTEERPKRGARAALIAVGLLAIVVFAPVVTFGFAYDDHWTVQSAKIHGRGLAPLLRALMSGQGVAQGIPDATRPAMVTSIWLDHAAFGGNPAGYHLHSLFLYAACSALSVLAVFAVTRSRIAAVIGGAWFAVAPVHAEVVAGVSYREDLIAGASVIGLVAWLFLPRRRSELVHHAVLAGALFALGLLAKESAVTLLPVVATIALCRAPRTWLRLRSRSVASLGVALLAWGSWRTWLRVSGRDDVPLSLVHWGVGERLLRTSRYLVRSTIDGLVPFRWSPDHPPEPSASAWWVLALGSVVLVVLALARERRNRPLAAGVAIAMLAGLPTSPLVSPINEHADRYLFVGTLGGAVVWGVFLARISAFVPERRHLLALAVVLLPVGVRAREASAPWRSDATLWRAATERSPVSPRAWTGLAWTLRNEGDLDGADQAVGRAIALDPRFLRARVTRLYNHLERGDATAARADIEEIRRLGGERQLGMRRAVQCVELSAARMRECIRLEGSR